MLIRLAIRNIGGGTPARKTLEPTPLFQVMFNFQNASAVELEWPGVTITTMAVDTGTAKFDLNLSMEEKGTELSGCWIQYNLFESSTSTEC